MAQASLLPLSAFPLLPDHLFRARGDLLCCFRTPGGSHSDWLARVPIRSLAVLFAIELERTPSGPQLALQDRLQLKGPFADRQQADLLSASQNGEGPPGCSSTIDRDRNVQRAKDGAVNHGSDVGRLPFGGHVLQIETGLLGQG